MRSQLGSIDPVTGTIEAQQPGVGDLKRQRLPVCDREHRIRGAVDDQGGRADRRQGFALPAPVRDEVMVLEGGEVARALDVAANEFSNRRLIEPPPATRQHARVVDQVGDDGVRVRPVDLTLDTNRPNASVGPGSSR